MPSVLHFRKQLTAPPVAVDAPGFHVRQLCVPDDVSAWLALRERAMADQTPAVRTWDATDFHSEMTKTTWWRNDWSWVAARDSSSNKANEIIGAVTLALRDGATATIPVVHWLVVDPAFRRRGIARSLISQLECAAWEADWREVQLETHAGWSAAVAFYQSIGYALRERSPR
jgi:GNAT superfamily N-acetyltransferase